MPNEIDERDTVHLVVVGHEVVVDMLLHCTELLGCFGTDMGEF